MSWSTVTAVSPTETEDNYLGIEEEFVIDFAGHEIGNISNETMIIIFPVFQLYPPALLYFAGALCIMFIIFGIPGNVISILALLKAERLRNVTTPLIVNLCVVDLFFCCFTLPLAAHTFIHRKWLLGDVLCRAFPLIRYSNTALSLFTVMAITVNRYVLIVHPNHYAKIFKKHVLTIIIIPSIWMCSFLMLTPPLFEVWGKFGYNPQVGTCTILPDEKKTNPKTYLYLSGFIFPSTVFIVCYSHIYYVVRKSSRNVKRSQSTVLAPSVSVSVDSGLDQGQEKATRSLSLKWINFKGFKKQSNVSHSSKNMTTNIRLLRTIFVIFCTFAICYLPVSLVKVFELEKDFPVLNILGYLGMYFTNCINPVIYVVMSKEYRQAYRELLTCNHDTTVSATESKRDNC